jgi:uncharacterized protein
VPASGKMRNRGSAWHRRPFRMPSDSGRASISTSSISLPTNWKPRDTRRGSSPNFHGQRHMILPDVNVLVHAHNADSAVHPRARQWWDECLSGSEGVGLAWAAVLGFIRLTTNRRVVARPLHVQDAMARVAIWLDLPHVHMAQPSATHFARLRTELERLGTAGNLTTDAHLAVLAMERGYVLYTTDADFMRFPGLRWVNPCA